jgi:leader peptidase (prepilin peptidase)/N-methyltransferase
LRASTRRFSSRHRAASGLGDVKLAALVGLFLGWLGWRTLTAGTFAAFLLAAVATVPLLLRRLDRKTRIPFAPFMITGALISIVLVR